MEKKQKAPKEKRRNNEKRKEKSRNAARCRRSKETELYYDLANSLPFTSEHISQLDKASVMRLAISYLKIRNMIKAVPSFVKSNENKTPTDSLTFLKTLDGYVMILSEEGDFIYLSENVHEYLGINQIDLMGQNVFEYSHPCDHEEIRETLSGKTNEDVSKFKSLFIRMKCTLTNKGRSVTLKSAIYKVIHCTGHTIKYENHSKVKNEKTPETKTRTCFIAVNQPIPHPSNIESPLPKQMFLTKHSMDMKFTHADDEFMKQTLGYDSDDLLGKSAYEFHHAMDSDSILSSYKCLFAKGQCQTEKYRFLAKSGGYVWIITQATLIHDKNQKPQSVVCVNYVISGLECEDELYSSSQYSTIKAEVNNNCKLTNKTVVPEIVISANENRNEGEVVNQKADDQKPIFSTRRLFGNLKEVEGSVRPRTATSKIFGPRTKDMSRGFLTFSDEEPGLTMLKDEPEDLTHLAPVAGDVCVPLEDNNFLPDMLDDILLKDNFGPLLTEEPSDPFIAYRDFQDTSPQLLSPNLSKHSDCSLHSPSDSLIDDNQSFMNLQMEEDVELLKTPYISMNINDDLPLLISNDLMWSTSDKKTHNCDSSPSLAELLSKSLNKHQIKQNDHGGGVICKHEVDDMYNIKNTRKSWNDQNNLSPKSSHINKLDRTQSTKRSNCNNIYDHASKKTRNESKEKMSSELLQQLISNNHNRGRHREKNNWLLKSSPQKAACISQPSDSVLMNLLENADTTNTQNTDNIKLPHEIKDMKISQDEEKNRRFQLIRNSINLLDPEGTSLASLMDLTQQDFDVNAPVDRNLLQGTDLLTALDINLASI